MDTVRSQRKGVSQKHMEERSGEWNMKAGCRAGLRHRGALSTWQSRCPHNCPLHQHHSLYSVHSVWTELMLMRHKLSALAASLWHDNALNDDVLENCWNFPTSSPKIGSSDPSPSNFRTTAQNPEIFVKIWWLVSEKFFETETIFPPPPQHCLEWVCSYTLAQLTPDSVVTYI